MERIKKYLSHLLSIEKSPHKLAVGCCLGIFIAMSPFLGIQTWIAIPLSWLFRVNALVVITVLYIVNNPFTMIPIVLADYIVGHWIMVKWLHVDLASYNPSWIHWLELKIGPALHKYLGVTSICFWCYLAGGIILALLCSISLYPLLRFFFVRTMTKFKHK